MKKLELININKSYEHDIPVLKNVSFSVDNGDFVVLLGPSGSGKSTILSIIAGFEQQNAGDVVIDGNNCNKVPCQYRDIAMVFQNYALYPSMNVYNNIAFPLVNKREKKTVIDQKVKKIAKMLQIEDILKKKVDKISGGQKQRVAIGRALIRKPTLLLLDEPLSNLDAVLRMQMREELFNLHSQVRVTMIYVTHDQIEALSLATKIIVLNDGKIQQIGTPKEIYDFPKNEFVATFIGNPQMNLFKECSVFSKDNNEKFVLLLGQELPIETNISAKTFCLVDIGVRAEDIVLIKNDSGKTHILYKEFLGDSYVYHCKTQDVKMTFHFCTKTKDDYCTTHTYDVKILKAHFFDASLKIRLSTKLLKNKENNND